MDDPFSIQQGDVLAEVQGAVGLITLNRAKALNALSLGMVRSDIARHRTVRLH